jgi:UDP-glucuronate 4-epimerase
MKHILVTGGAGFIGSNLIHKLLLTGGWRVTCLDNFDPFYSRRQKEINVRSFFDNPHFELIEGDVCNAADLEKLETPDVIVHLAGKAGVRQSIEEAGAYFNVNVGGTQTLLDFSKKRAIRQFVFASSSSVYGINENIPWREKDMALPISPYASSKFAAEMLGHAYSHLFGIRFIALRFFTVYGPGQRPDLAVYKFFHSILRNEEIPVFGKGDSRRDYTYIDDTINGIIAALSYENSNFEVINIGNNQTVPLTALIAAIERVCNRKAIFKYHPAQAGDLFCTCADITKANLALKYIPETDLLKGLTNFYNWFKANESLLNRYAGDAFRKEDFINSSNA